MRVRSRGWKGALVAALALAAVMACASVVALAASRLVVIYYNNLSKPGQARQLARAEGSKCSRSFDRGSLLITAAKGPEICGFRLPVQGEVRQPDHDLQAKLKIQKLTKPKERKRAFVGLQVRSGSGTDYELRVYPKGRKFVVRRNPSGSGFPVKGTMSSIHPIGKWNLLQIQALGRHVKAWVNDHKVADRTDSNPSAVMGKKLEIMVANGRKTHNDVVARAENLRVAVLRP